MKNYAILFLLCLMYAGVAAQKAKRPVQEPPPASSTESDESEQLKDPIKEPAKDTTHKAPAFNDLDQYLKELQEFSARLSAGSTDSKTEMKTVAIGSQAWLSENLNVSTFRNGDAIPEAKTDSEWQVAFAEKKPVWCYYNNDAANAKYGKLYNLYAVTDPRGLAPAGYHIPTKAEWTKMIAELPADAETIRRLRGTGTGDYGFVQGGYRTEWEFKSIGLIGQWWSSTQTRIIGSYASSVSTGCYVFSLNTSYHKFGDGTYSTEGLSVRCVKD